MSNFHGNSHNDIDELSSKQLGKEYKKYLRKQEEERKSSKAGLSMLIMLCVMVAYMMPSIAIYPLTLAGVFAVAIFLMK